MERPLLKPWYRLSVESGRSVLRYAGSVLDFEGKDQAVRLRGVIRAALGPTTERLTQFGIRPFRRRQLAQQEPPKPAPQPEIAAAPADRSHP